MKCMPVDLLLLGFWPEGYGLLSCWSIGHPAMTSDRTHSPRRGVWNGCCKSFNARFPDELLNGEIFCSLKEAQTLIEQWRRHYNTKRPHSAPGYRPPTPETVVPMDQTPVMH